MIGVDVGIGLMPQDGMFHETKKTVEAFSLFGDPRVAQLVGGHPQVALEVSLRALGVPSVVSHSAWAGLNGSFAETE